MPVFPDLDTAKAASMNPDYTVIPVALEMLCDFITPIETLKILKGLSSHVFLLESAAAYEQWGRYTFLGFEPRMEITCSQGILKAGGIKVKTDAPMDVIRDILSEWKAAPVKGMPPFTGGLMGYFSFESFGYAEPTAIDLFKESEDFRDLDLMLFDELICFDHVKQKLFLITHAKLDNIEASYPRAIMRLKMLKDIIENGVRLDETPGKLQSPFRPQFEKETFVSMVDKAKEHITAGDIFQIVLANRFEADFEGSLLQTYRILRTLNPSPYMFYFCGDDLEAGGASPETLVRLDHGTLHTFPLAGTRKRGRNEAEDLALEKELLADEKELAEHNMLVDLGRNDLGCVSAYGSVKVESLREIQRYSHVMHIGSVVRSTIADDKDHLDALASVLPAGTLSGAPKIRAVQLIDQLEQSRRGIYGGAVGYIDFSGNMDMCIAIRLAYKKGNKVYVHSGAGIVADSIGENEYQECLNKAAGCMEAIRQAQEESL